MKTMRDWRRSLIVASLMGTAALAFAADADHPHHGDWAFTLGVGLGITAFVAWGRASFPDSARKADVLVEAHPASKTFLVGAINAAIVLGVLFGIMKTVGGMPGPLGPVLALIALTVVALAFRGALAVWPSYGHLILGRDEAATELQATLAGGAFLTAMLMFFPFGTLFFAYAAIRSLGTSMMMLTSEKR